MILADAFVGAVAEFLYNETFATSSLQNWENRFSIDGFIARRPENKEEMDDGRNVDFGAVPSV
jgi:hypothetical protein